MADHFDESHLCADEWELPPSLFRPKNKMWHNADIHASSIGYQRCPGWWVICCREKKIGTAGKKMS
ncbi:hypothetical protein [Breznakibacter xylanolyticus]|uniref:hypothetical protein n=1 Tax=Breznakibacter xylanolyticus TaxID=990 RepID=UPI000DAE02BA|nr:hypothetical protein [Breznakibacter xylanolyticus]